MNDDAASAEPQTVLEFWFGETGSVEHGTQRKVWFTKNDTFDRCIEQRFGTFVERSLRGELDGWAAVPLSALARILLLDQFTRNIFRCDRRAFAGDGQALAAARAAVGAGFDARLPSFMRPFFYMPFEHAESRAMQDEAVRLFDRLAAESSEFDEMLRYAERHRKAIERFGRFPHRNAALGRRSTAEELAFLAEPGSGF